MASPAFAIGPHDIHQLSRPRTVRTSKLRTATQCAHQLAHGVEAHWEEMPPAVKASLKELAYEIVEPPRGFRGVAHHVAASVMLAAIALRGERDALLDYLAAVRRLVNAVLGAVERDQPAYRNQLEKAVGDGLSESQGAQSVPEDMRGWLAALSDQAHREL